MGVTVLATTLATMSLVGTASADGTPPVLTGATLDGVPDSGPTTWYLGSTHSFTFQYADANTAIAKDWALQLFDGTTKVATLATGTGIAKSAPTSPAPVPIPWSIPASATKLADATKTYTVKLVSTATGDPEFAPITDAGGLKLSAPQIDTVTPTSTGTSVAQGGTYTVTWANTGGVTSPMVDIGLVDGTGKKKIVLAKATANDRSETVTIPVSTALGEWNVTVTPSLKLVTAGKSASPITVTAYAKPTVALTDPSDHTTSLTSVARGGTIEVTVAAASSSKPVDVVIKSGDKVVATIAKKLTSSSAFTYTLDPKLAVATGYKVEASLSGVKGSNGTPATLDITAPTAPAVTVTTAVSGKANQGEFVQVAFTSPSATNSVALVDASDKETKLLSKVPAGTYFLEIPLKAAAAGGYKIAVTNDTLKKGDAGLRGESTAFAVVANATTLGSK